MFPSKIHISCNCACVRASLHICLSVYLWVIAGAARRARHPVSAAEEDVRPPGRPYQFEPDSAMINRPTVFTAPANIRSNDSPKALNP